MATIKVRFRDKTEPVEFMALNKQGAIDLAVKVAGLKGYAIERIILEP